MDEANEVVEVIGVKKDCFGYKKELNRCVILNETYCKKEKCRFYKKKGTLCDGCPDVNNKSACIRCIAARKK